MAKARTPRTPRQKYGEELKLRRIAAEMTQEMLSEIVVCSPTLISHFEAGRRLPNPDDAKRIDAALGTDGFFSRWLKDLDSKYADHFAAVAELERQASEIRHYGSALIPGILQTKAYAQAIFRSWRPNYWAEDLNRLVVNRIERSEVLKGPNGPVVWTLLDEAALRRKVGGPQVMAEQLRKIEEMGEAGRLRLHVLTFEAGEHALAESMLYLMNFEDAPPIAYVEGLYTGHLMDQPALVSSCQAAYDLALGDALSHKDSLALIRAVAEEYEHEQQ
ncbi:helix-turn-helix domain-containing protein [Streptomyces odonnellii]|uniref:helix-turn-helix domain-containing protein n=1 Tax=Streptomyces odonnellii TaxID=1417980 RepID=UPI00062678D5|nr:helix-turn-helix transcriptional regulator [Streptomyces odonnellii]